MISICMIWGKPLNIVMEKIYAYDKLHTDVDIQCTANAIVDLCQDRDNHRYDYDYDYEMNLLRHKYM